MMMSVVSARRRYRERSSFTSASGTLRPGFAVRFQLRAGLAFRDDREDLDFLVSDVIEDAYLVDTEPKLGASQAAQALDSTPGRFGWVIPEMPLQCVHDRSALVGRERPKIERGASRKYDLE